MTRAEAARRYLQASMGAHTTALPGEAKEAHETTMARLERQHPGAAELAVVGANSDFDRNLHPGEREHQQHLRAGASQNELRARRARARGEKAPPSPSSRRPGAPARRRSAVRAGVAGGRTYARARRTIASSSGIQDTGSLALQAIGVAVGLSLLYLTLSPNGSKAFSTLLDGITKFTRLLVGPYDPLNPPKAETQQQSLERQEHNFPAVTVPRQVVSRQQAKLNPRFGPAPGIGSALIGGGTTP